MECTAGSTYIGPTDLWAAVTITYSLKNKYRSPFHSINLIVGEKAGSLHYKTRWDLFSDPFLIH